MGIKQYVCRSTLLIASGVLAAACSAGGGAGGGAGEAPATALTLSGSVALKGSSSSKVTPISKPASALGALASKVGVLAVSSYRISCATFEDTPKSCGSAVATDGTFSVTCEGFATKPFGCFVYNTTSYANYPVTFNVAAASTDDAPALTSNAGTVTLSIAIDTETGTAGADVTLPATTTADEAVGGSGTATLADLQKLGGGWKMAPATWASVSSKYSAEELTAMIGTSDKPAYVEFEPSWSGGPPQCPTGTTMVPAWEESTHYLKRVCRFTPASAQVVYDFYSCTEMGDRDLASMQTCVDAAIAGTVSYPSTIPADASLHFNAISTAGGLRLGVWPSSGALAKCGGDDAAPVFKFSDGTTNVEIDMTPAGTLMSELTTKVDSAVATWFPMLSGIGGGGGGETVSALTCKYAFNLPGDFHNHTPEQLAACKADNTNCLKSDGSYGRTEFDALWRYKWATLYSGTDASGDDILVGAGTNAAWNLANSVVATAGATKGYATMNGWDSQNNRPQMEVVADEGTVQTLELGGCMQWNTDGTQTIVPVGDYITYRNHDNTITEQKCNWNERRSVIAVPDATGNYFTFNGNKYRDAFFFVEVAGQKYQTWNKVCEVDLSAGANFYNSFPADMSDADITADITARRSGGSPQYKAGLRLELIMRLLDKRDLQISENDKFFYHDPGTGMGYDVTCKEILTGTDQPESQTVYAAKSDVWNALGSIVDNASDAYNASKAISCGLIAIANGVYVNHDAGAGTGDPGVSGVPPGVTAAFQDGNSNNVPDIFETVADNSCLPRIQIASICTKAGCEEPRVICNDIAAADGGCSAADPQSRMALLTAIPVESGKFLFSNKDEWYRFEFNPETNSGKKCTSTSVFQLKNDTAVTSAPAAGTTILMSMQQSEKQVCDGDTVAESRTEPKRYMRFEKL